MTDTSVPIGTAFWESVVALDSHSLDSLIVETGLTRVVDEVAESLISHLDPAATTTFDFTVDVQLECGDEVEFASVTFHDGQALLERAPSADAAEVRVRMPLASFLKLLAGSVDALRLLRSARVKGDYALLLKLLQALR